MSDLADQQCVSCRGGEPPFDAEDVRRFLKELKGWEAVEDHHLLKRWERRDFAEALDLANRFGAISAEQGHHPVLSLSWGWIEVRLWTHKVDGLTISDFILAARFDRVAGTR